MRQVNPSNRVNTVGNGFIGRTGRFLSGIGPAASALPQFMQMAVKYGCRPTFPVDASLIERSPRLFQDLQASGAELALLGNSLNRGSSAGAKDHDAIGKAVEAFDTLGLTVRGYRDPYMVVDAESSAFLASIGLVYVGNRTMAWDVMDREQFNSRSLEAYQRLLTNLNAENAVSSLSLPRWDYEMVNLPLAMPDGAVSADTLRLDRGSMASVWLRILQRVHRLGELMVINVKADRFPECSEALETLLGRAKQYDPGVWIASAEEVALWWKGRSQSSISLKDLGEGRYEVAGTGASTLTLLLRNIDTDGEAEPWHLGYMRVKGEGAVINSNVRPCIGVASEVPEGIFSMITEMGFVAERSEQRDTYAFYLDGSAQYANPRDVLAAIEGSDASLVRLGPWPNGAGCALAVTGDVTPMSITESIRHLFGAFARFPGSARR